MMRAIINIGACIMLAIPIVSFLVMWEVVTLPRSHHWIGYFVAGYLMLIMLCLTFEIVRDVWRWWRR